MTVVQSLPLDVCTFTPLSCQQELDVHLEGTLLLWDFIWEKILDPQTLCQDPCMIIYNTCGICIFWGSTSTHAHTFYLCSNGGEYDSKSTLHAHIQKLFFRWNTHRSNWIFCCIRIHSLGLVVFAWKISLREYKGLDMSTTDLCWMYIPYNNSRTQKYCFFWLKW